MATMTMMAMMMSTFDEQWAHEVGGGTGSQ
jgi:hypothetical protein